MMSSRAVCGAMLLATLGASTTAHAAEVWVASVIKAVYPQANGSAVLTFQSDMPNCTSPANPKYYVLMVGQNGVTAEGFKNILASALAAAAAGKQVQVAFDDSTSNCFVNRLYAIFN